MRIVFNGLMEKSGGGGCKVCGKRRKSDYHFVSTKEYFLPSGLTQTFYVGKEAEVSDRDGAFLLSYETDDGNGTRKVFTRVD